MARRTFNEAMALLRASQSFGMYQSLDHMRGLCIELDNPQTKWVPIHVTGTNGKTSVSRLIDALLRASGQRSGVTTSPHLLEVNERIVIDGHPLDDEAFIDALSAALDAGIRLKASGEAAHPETPVNITEFEHLIAAAFYAMAKYEVDFGVIEAGIGGLWDATCVINPAVSVITSVGLDHVHVLGETLEEIAQDKSNIIKPGCTAILGDGLDGLYDIFTQRAESVGAHVRAVRHVGADSPVIDELTTRYEVVAVKPHSETVIETTFTIVTPFADYGVLAVSAPQYQACNIATAITAVEAALGRALDVGEVAACIAHMTFPGRFEVVQAHPLVLFDGAHNPQAAHILADMLALAQIRPTIAIGCFEDKDFAGMIELLAPVADGFVVVKTPSDRARSIESMVEIIQGITEAPIRGAFAEPTLEQLEELSEGGPLVITGSLSLYSLLKSRLALTGEVR